MIFSSRDRTLWPHLWPLVLLVLTLVLQQSATAQLRIVTYNTANSGENGSPTTPRIGVATVLEAIGNESRAGIARPIDVLALQEQQSSATTTSAIVSLLNTIYGAGTYARSPFDANTLGAGRAGLIYNTQTVQLISSTGVGNTSGSGASRQPVRYQLRPVGYQSNSDFYLYNSHYNSTSEPRRNVEAQTIRANADALGQGASVIFAGDFNIDSSSEAMYQTLLSNGSAQAFDPINTPGNWNNSSSLRITHTQSPYNPAFNDPSLVSGGMDDRFDFQLVTDELRDMEGLSFLPGTYRAFGNNASHALNDYINDPSNTAQPINVLNALARATDHLPVVADYQIPAVMQLAVSIPPRVIRGGQVEVPVQIWNSANVDVFQGADELDFSVMGSGGIAGSESGTDAALGNVPQFLFPLDTSTGGLIPASVVASTTSPQVPESSITNSSQYLVLNSAMPSFNSAGSQTDLQVDFGTVIPSGQTQQLSFQLHNLLQAGVSSLLDLDSIMGSGDTAVLSNTLAPFAGLFSGTAQPFTVEMTTTESGTFSVAWDLSVSDEDIPGEQIQQLTITAVGRVALPGDANLDGFVDGDDFLTWNISKFQTGTDWSTGDFNFDGITDGFDFAIWNMFKFQSLDQLPQPVPEPLQGTWILGLALLARRIRDRQRKF